MAVSTSYAPLSYSGNGATVAFAITWPFFSGTDIVAILIDADGVEATKALTTHYSVTGGQTVDGIPSTGTLTMVTAPASGETLRIHRATSKVQSATWTNGGSFQAKTIEAMADRLTLISQEIAGSSSGGGSLVDGVALLFESSSEDPDFYDARDQIIRNVADPVEDDDAVTKGYGDTNYGGAAAAAAAASASSAASSATSASASATAAAAAYDSFDDRFLGAKTSDPLVDNDGAALSVGTLYFNTPSNTMRIYSGSAWSDITGVTSVNGESGIVTIDAHDLGGVTKVATRTALKALAVATGIAYLTESGREGVWVYRTGNYATRAAADTHELMYVVSNSVASSVGCWVRDGELDMGGATLALTTGVNLPNGLRIRNGTLDFSGAPTASWAAYGEAKACVIGSGTIVQIADLSVSPAAGSISLTFAAAHGLAIGDVICIYNPTDYSWSANRSYFRAGEYCRVVGVPTTTTVKIDGGLWAAYDHTVVDIYKVSPWRGSLRDVTIKGNADVASVTYGLAIVFGDRVDLDGVVASDVSYTCIAIDKCFECRVYRCSGAEDGAAQFGGDYGLGIYNSQRIDVERCSFTSARHGITHGGGSGPGCVPVRSVHHRFNNAASAVNQFGFDIHGNCEAVLVENCRMPDAIDFGGRGHTFRSCYIRNFRDVQYAVYAAETHSGRMLFDDCDFDVTNGTIVNTSRGVFDVGGNSTPLDNLAGDVTFEIRNCRYAGNSANSVSFACLRNNSPTYKANIIIDGLTMANASTTLLFSGIHIAGMPAADVHAFRRINGFAGTSAGVVSWNVNSYAQPAEIDVDYHGWTYRRPVVPAGSTVALTPKVGACQYWGNVGAHTIAAPTLECQMMLEIWNDTGAGAVTFSGFTKVTGDVITTTVGHKFQIFVSKGAFFSLAHVRALQ